MKKLILMSGIPGSGKSTYTKLYQEKHCKSICISRDKIRFSLLEDGDEYFSKETEVFKTFVDKIANAFECYDEVIADATHISPQSRYKLFNALSGRLPKDIQFEAIVLDTSLETALRFNELRKDTDRYVPKGVIRRMHSQYEKPTFNEGFDKITIIKKDKEGKTIVRINVHNSLIER